MTNKKAFMLLGETAVKLLVAIFASLLLIGLGVLIYQAFIPNSEVRHANQELQSLQLELQRLSKDSPNPNEYLILQAPSGPATDEWLLVALNQGRKCNGSFCLCICDEALCSNEENTACVATDKAISITQIGREEGLAPITKTPKRIELSYIDEKVFPYNLNEEKTDIGVGVVFYQFRDGEWRWSVDLEEWVDTNTFEGSGVGLNDDYTNFIKNVIAGKSEQEGRAALSRITTESKGVYRIDA